MRDLIILFIVVFLSIIGVGAGINYFKQMNIDALSKSKIQYSDDFSPQKVREDQRRVMDQQKQHMEDYKRQQENTRRSQQEEQRRLQEAQKRQMESLRRQVQ